MSKLPLGVAAVYQNEWPEAVLCKIEAYPMPENAVYHKPSKMPHEINAEFVFGQLAAGKELEPLSVSEMEQLKRWLKRHEMMLKPEDGRYLEQVFAGGELDVAKTRKAVFDFFGGISTVVDYCAAAEKSFTPRKEFLEQLENSKGKICDLVIPILFLIVACILSMLYVGGYWGEEKMSLFDAFGNTDAGTALALGALVTLIFSFIYFMLRKVLTFRDFFKCINPGVNSMVAACIILTLAWTISGVCRDLLSTGPYVAHLVETSGVPVGILPALIFVVACFLSFSAGTA